MGTIRYPRISIHTRFSGQFFFQFLWKKIVMEKKVVVPCLDIIMIPFFPRNIHLSSLFAQKERLNTERVPPGHPIILLKSNKFNMAAALVKRSINYDRWDDLPRRVATSSRPDLRRGQFLPCNRFEVEWIRVVLNVLTEQLTAFDRGFSS